MTINSYFNLLFLTQASNDTKCIASAHWLNDILAQQKMFPPSNPLHFPTALKETPEWCKKMVYHIQKKNRQRSFIYYSVDYSHSGLLQIFIYYYIHSLLH